MSTRSLKYTVRVNTRDDADIVEHLRGKNVSKTFKNALRAQKDNKLDAKIREHVAGQDKIPTSGQTFSPLSDKIVPTLGQ